MAGDRPKKSERDNPMRDIRVEKLCINSASLAIGAHCTLAARAA